MKKKRWILIIILLLGCGCLGYFYYINKMNDKYNECLHRIESCRQDHSRGKNIYCAACCRKNGEEEVDVIKCAEINTNKN